jgi:hypothetical protein
MLILVVLCGTGCQGVLSRCGPQGSSEFPSACGPAAPPCPAPCPQPCPQPCPSEKPAHKEAAPPPPKPQEKQVERVEQVSHQAQIAQEVMLVPRTVYVPYVAQTPVAPVRLSSLNAIEGRVTGITERREFEQRAVEPDINQRLADLDKKLNTLVDVLENHHQVLEGLKKQAAPPPPCPAPSAPLPCPTPGAPLPCPAPGVPLPCLPPIQPPCR